MLLIDAQGDDIGLSLPAGWLEAHPLTQAELVEEARRLEAGGFRMHLR